jgi:single-stranded DNA-binding protein
MFLVNVVVLVGVVRERPFRPGGDRCVLKLAVAGDKPDAWDLIEVDVFGGAGDFAMGHVGPGQMVAIRGRLENRRFRDRPSELRVVAHRVNKVQDPTRRGDGAGDGRERDRGRVRSDSDDFDDDFDDEDEEDRFNVRD